MIDVLALVPARGGSKSIPRKNIAALGGHPLIAYSIAAGLQARLVTRTVVSTDDEEIAAVARQYGADVPFLRPAEFAQDNTTDFPVFTHALGWLAENEGYSPQIVVQLRPTSPIRPPDLVDEAVQILIDHVDADSVRGVVPSGQNPHKMWRITPNGRMAPLLAVEGLAEPYNAPRQALPPTYWQTGHIDAIRVSTIIQQNSLSGEVILPVIVDSRYTIDIDTPRDLERAASLLQSGLAMVKPLSSSPLPMGSGSDSLFPAGGAPGTRTENQAKRSLPATVALVVFDFDGVMTDDHVWIDQDGRELVMASRADGRGVSMLKHAGIDAIVLSSEVNPVVAARCHKLKIPCFQGIEGKAPALQNILAENGLPAAQVVYVGNDLNDLPCFPLVGCAVAPADAHPDVLARADLVLSKNGGHGAVRELSELILGQP
ncbi:MAG: cytidylyltransferase domain-containing protein [Chloroflexota bacterium]